MSNIRTAELLRPKNIDEIVGQPHLFGERGVVRRMLEAGRLTNMIFYGPPGTGKTTAASIIARQAGMTFHRLNATTASVTQVKEILAETERIFGSDGILLYIDEIQYFNRKQQQTLLEYIEDGRVTLIASTTENPHFCIYNAVISRSSLFEFKPVTPEETTVVLRRALAYLNDSMNTSKTADAQTLVYIGKLAAGDVRRAINLLESAFFMSGSSIESAHIDELTPLRGNFGEDTHYDLLSALQKSIRGSDPDAAVFYLVRLLELGELLSVCRRMLVIAAEDVGLAYPQAMPVTYAAVESARELGMPEARIPLAAAAIMLATSPKSNTAYLAAAAAGEDVAKGLGTVIPEHLQSPLFRGYKYPHDFPNHYIEQQYLPDDLKGKRYYSFGNNKIESAAAAYADRIKGKSDY